MLFHSTVVHVSRLWSNNNDTHIRAKGTCGVQRAVSGRMNTGSVAHCTALRSPQCRLCHSHTV